MTVYKTETHTPPLKPTTIKSRALYHLDKIPTQNTEQLAAPLSYENIHTALLQSPNHKSPGLNGILTELYKKLNNRWQALKEDKNENLDIVKIIHIVANNIERNGVTVTQLTDGWVCPTYKKKDKREIVNYHPITVLNLEYKIITMVLMNKLAIVAPTLVNKSQATFIEGRSILDQIDLVNRMVNLCEIIDQEGAIIALDQEKAYNRIHHDYLWKTMEAMNFPENLIFTIKCSTPMPNQSP